MQCIVMYATDTYYHLSKLSSETSILNSGYLPSRHHIYVSKDEKIRGNFLKPNGSTSRNIWLHCTILSYTKYRMVINIKNLVSALVPVRYEILTAVLMMIQAYCLILKMQTQCSFKTSVTIY